MARYGVRLFVSTLAVLLLPPFIAVAAVPLALLLFPVAWLGVLAMSRAYERRMLFVGPEEYQHVVRAGVRLTLGVALAAFRPGGPKSG